jgi:Fe-S-cluster containining protein
MECDQCGVCCKLFLINLTEKEYKSRKYKTQFEKFGLVNDFEEAEMCGANIITQKKDGSCIYQKDNKCSIHAKRPEACKSFFCKSNNSKFKDMIEMIKKHKIICKKY